MVCTPFNVLYKGSPELKKFVISIRQRLLNFFKMYAFFLFKLGNNNYFCSLRITCSPGAVPNKRTCYCFGKGAREKISIFERL